LTIISWGNFRENPKRFLEYYRIILSGDQPEASLRQIRMCAANVISYVNMDIFHRPFEVQDPSAGPDETNDNSEDETILLDLQN